MKKIKTEVNIIWRDDFTNEETNETNEYLIVRTNQQYNFFKSEDIVITTVSAYLKNGYSKLTGKFTNNYGYFVVAKDNTLHCETGPAICSPGGLNGFQHNKSVTEYCIHGKTLSKYSWLTWVKGTESWPEAMANILGSSSD